MADTGIFATTEEVKRYVPTWASTTSNVEAYINQFIEFWEAYTNCLTTINFSDIYSTLNKDFKRLLSLFVCVHVAMDVLNWDISGTDIRTAEFAFDRLTDVANRCEKQIKDNTVHMRIKEET